MFADYLLQKIQNLSIGEIFQQNAKPNTPPGKAPVLGKNYAPECLC